MLAIRPWIAPRVDVTRCSGGQRRETQTNFGLSGGIDLNLIFGLGLTCSYDRVWGDNGVKPSVFGVGAGWTFISPDSDRVASLFRLRARAVLAAGLACLAVGLCH